MVLPRGAAAMKTATLQQLLVTLIEAGQAIAAEPDDPMHGALTAASDIELVKADGHATVVVTTSGGRVFRVSISESR